MSTRQNLFNKDIHPHSPVKHSREVNTFFNHSFSNSSASASHNRSLKCFASWELKDLS